MSTATRARSHYRQQQKIALLGVRAVRRVVMQARTPAAASSAATATLATYQAASASSASATMASELGRAALSVPAQFAGTTQLGWPIETPIETIVDRLTVDLDGQLQRLTEEMLGSLDLLVHSEVIAAGADAASAEISGEPGETLYVRYLVLPSCSRCVALAGRVYRDLDGFPRHPKCDCEHWPVGTEAEAKAAGLVLDPMEALEAGQIGGYRTLDDGTRQWKDGLSIADAMALRDGADPAAVINASRGGGRRPAGMTNIVSAEIFGRTVKATLEGTTKRGEWRRRHPDLPIRLRPESIYAHARDRADVLRLLRLYGYLQ